ncbi:MAG: beta-ketoacyl synthase N-terminal-like domain-containing protein [Ilumatobacteraceae bacterium]
MSEFAPIAVVGRACVLPGALSPEQLWARVVAGDDVITQVPSGRWNVAADDVMCQSGDDCTDRTWSNRGGYVDGFETVFDPGGFGLPRDEIVALDPLFQWTFHTARAALRDAGHADGDADRFGAIFGNLSFPSAGMAAFVQASSLSDVTPDAPPADLAGARNRFMSGLPALLLEQALGLGAGAFALDAACASSLYAIKLACDRLHGGEADLMLAGAVNCADDLFIHQGFTALQALSPTGRSRPFHRDADGLVPAEGCGFLALRRLDDAVRDGDTIHGVIRGIGLSNDGRGRGMLVPAVAGQVRAMTEALTVAGLSSTAVSLLECHATGTAVGDSTEITSTAQVYADCSDLPIGSLKSNTGHLITAAGVAGIIKVIEAMRHEVRPPTLHAEEPVDALDGSPFRLLTEAEPWRRSECPDGVLRAGVSAFGFGGNNAHLIIEEPPSTTASSTASTTASTTASSTARTTAAGPTRTGPATTWPPTNDAPIAIVGIGVIAASAVGRAAFTAALIDDAACLDDDGTGPMPDIDLPIGDLKFPPNDLQAALGQQLAMLQVADEAIAGCGSLPTDRTGVYVGMGTDPQTARFGARWRLPALARTWGADQEWAERARDEFGPALTAAGVLGSMPNLVANRLNSQYDLGGPSCTVSAEEHSGLDALRLAVTALRAGDIDVALVGAVDLSCDPAHRDAADLVLPSDRRPPGDAAVMLVVKRLDDAVRDRDRVFSIIPGDADDVDDARAGDLQVGPGSDTMSVTHLFGHAHAASGLLHVAAAAVMLHHRVTIGDVPLLPSADAVGLPSGAGPRTVRVTTTAFAGCVPRSVLLAEASDDLAPSRVDAPRIHIYSGDDAAAVLEALTAGEESDVGPSRLVIVEADAEQFADRSQRARRHIQDGHPPGVGVRFRSAPMRGELAFVFTAGGAAYHGMGSQLFRALPEIADPISSTFPVDAMSSWIFRPDHDPAPADFLWGTSMLSQAHARLTLELLGLRPDAAIGYSSGESNMLFAFGVWTDNDAMRREIVASGMLDREIAGEFAAVGRAWGETQVDWAVWNVLAPVDEVRNAIVDELRVHLMLINTARDVVIGGDATACERLVDVLGAHRCRPVRYNLACHVPEVRAEFHQPWVDVHTRAVTPVDGVRFYSNGVGGAYEVSTEACAEAITRQAETTVDFPATIRAAYDDGVRIFVEHGPSSACTNFISQILADRDIIALHLDRRDRGIEQVFDVCAELVASAVDVDHRSLTERLTRVVPTTTERSAATMSFPAHRPVPNLTAWATDSAQVMSPAPTLPTVLGDADRHHRQPAPARASRSSDTSRGLALPWTTVDLAEPELTPPMSPAITNQGRAQPPNGRPSPLPAAPATDIRRAAALPSATLDHPETDPATPTRPTTTDQGRAQPPNGRTSPLPAEPATETRPATALPSATLDHTETNPATPTRSTNTAAPTSDADDTTVMTAIDSSRAFDPTSTSASASMAAALLEHLTAMTRIHETFVADQAELHQKFLATRNDFLAVLTLGDAVAGPGATDPITTSPSSVGRAPHPRSPAPFESPEPGRARDTLAAAGPGATDPIDTSSVDTTPRHPSPESADSPKPGRSHDADVLGDAAAGTRAPDPISNPASRVDTTPHPRSPESFDSPKPGRARDGLDAAGTHATDSTSTSPSRVDTTPHPRSPESSDSQRPGRPGDALAVGDAAAGSDVTDSVSSPATHAPQSGGSLTRAGQPSSDTAEPASNRPEPAGPRGPVWGREELEIHSSGTISDLFGPMFVPQDRHTLQCRMPEPPLLLADRVTGLDAPPGVLGTGTIWTETDVQRDAWYLNGGYMPAGFMIESGQADLMLISWMGIDLLNQGRRSYRLLGCTLTYHGDLPSVGETLEYEIRITGHAEHGDIRLFFFEYDCVVAGRPRLTVRDAQAGFFTRAELDDAQGVLWTPEVGRAALRDDARVDPPVVVGTKASFTRDEVTAFSEGRVLECFGRGFEWAETHTRTPRIQAGEQLFIDEVTMFDPAGGPWGRGFMRCETEIADDAWFFDGHFKNDPCMPGNFMVEACIEAMSFYLAALGHTTRADGWRFRPLPGQPFELKCRGEINPQTERVAYELYVEEVWAGPHPTLVCDVLGFVDGEPAFHAHRIGVEMVPDWPLTTMPDVYEHVVAPVAVATDAEGFAFDWKAMISCAWGRPSEAFGSMYEVFDGTRRSPRLPGPPYHFMSRVVDVIGELGVCAAGMEVVCEYDIPDDAWFFDENGAETMPFAVLLECALQPCGWVASAVGSVTGSDDDMLFRNLDGTGTVVGELTRDSGTLTTRVTLTNVSRAGGMIVEGFDVTCSLGDRPVYSMQTVFGFFPPEAFEDQVGLPVTDRDRALLAVVSSSSAAASSSTSAELSVDLTTRPARFCSGTARLADDMLLMLDRATHARGAGAAQLGVVVGAKDVDVSEWFFKAHFFQDPVQPGSLGVEALLQLLQFFMLDTEMDVGLDSPRFEPMLLGTPMTWKYRGQVTPRNSLITTVMEIAEVGVDDRGPYVIGAGSLWCDGLRIYEVSDMGMRLVSTAPDGHVAGASSLDLTVSRDRHPQVVDHAVDGSPVVPVAFVVEWFTRLARSHRPDLHLTGLADVRVLSGIVADRYADGEHLDLRASVAESTDTVDGVEIGLELRNVATGRLHYRGRALLSSLPGRETFEGVQPVVPSDSSAAAVYDGDPLFHGPAFRVIETVSPADGGLAATLLGVDPMGWPDDGWVTDPALFDGALQLALLWTRRQLDARSLPTAIKRIRHIEPAGTGPHTARLTGVRTTPTMAVCDVTIASSNGTIVAVLEGIETHVLPRLP